MPGSLWQRAVIMSDDGTAVETNPCERRNTLGRAPDSRRKFENLNRNQVRPYYIYYPVTGIMTAFDSGRCPRKIFTIRAQRVISWTLSFGSTELFGWSSEILFGFVFIVSPVFFFCPSTSYCQPKVSFGTPYRRMIYRSIFYCRSTYHYYININCGRGNRTSKAK